MKLRDSLNSIDGYVEIIEFYEETLKEDIEEYNEKKDKWDEQRTYDQFFDLFKYSFKVLTARYSMGDDISKLKSIYSDSISYIEKGWKAESGYVQMVSMLSIGIMLEIEDNKFNTLVKLVERDNVKDFLIDFLINYRISSWQQTEKFIWNKPYKSITEVIATEKNDKVKAIEQLRNYMIKGWYNSIDTKTHKSKHNIHAGYWSWEAGALVKILKLDDSSLKNQPYYPYDMVHWKNG